MIGEFDVNGKNLGGGSYRPAVEPATGTPEWNQKNRHAMMWQWRDGIRLQHCKLCGFGQHHGVHCTSS